MVQKNNYLNNFILVGVIAGLTALLDYIGVVGFPVGIFGVSAFYIGFAFYTGFAIWFGVWGLIAMYIGLLIGALLTGMFSAVTFILALGNVLGAAVPMVAFKMFNLDESLRKTKDYIAYIMSSTIAQSIIAAGWVLTGFAIVGIMPAETAKIAFTGWIIGDILVSILIGIPLLKFVTPVIKKTSLYKKGYV
jgi:hypothetical protein